MIIIRKISKISYVTEKQDKTSPTNEGLSEGLSLSYIFYPKNYTAKETLDFLIFHQGTYF